VTAYKKEVYFTIILTILFLISGHTGLLFVIFAPDGAGATFLGFPIHFIIPVIMGWFGVLVLTIIAGYMGNYLDEEIEKEDAMTSDTPVSEGEKPISL